MLRTECQRGRDWPHHHAYPSPVTTPCISMRELLLSSQFQSLLILTLNCCLFVQLQVVPNSLWPHGLLHTRLLWSSPSPRVSSSSSPLSHWYHPTISSSVIPFSTCPHSFPASGSFKMNQFFSSGCQRIGASVLASVFPVNSRDWFLRIDWFDFLAVQGTLWSLLQHHNLKAWILQCPAFFMVQHRHPYMAAGKTIALAVSTFIGKMMPLVVNMLSSFMIAIPPRGNRPLILWLQSPSAVILEPKKRKSASVSTFSPPICHEVMALDTMILIFECWVLSQLLHSPCSLSSRE